MSEAGTSMFQALPDSRHQELEYQVSQNISIAGLPTTNHRPDLIRVKSHSVSLVGASDMQGLRRCWIGHDRSRSYVWRRRDRALLGPQQKLSDARASPIGTDQASAYGFGPVGELCCYGEVS